MTDPKKPRPTVREREERYLGTMARVGVIVQMMVTLPPEDVEAARDELKRAEDFGLFTDPTAWMKNSSGRSSAIVLLDALLPFAREAEKVRVEVEALRAQRGS